MPLFAAGVFFDAIDRPYNSSLKATEFGSQPWSGALSQPHFAIESPIALRFVLS